MSCAGSGAQPAVEPPFPPLSLGEGAQRRRHVVAVSVREPAGHERRIRHEVDGAGLHPTRAVWPQAISLG